VACAINTEYKRVPLVFCATAVARVSAVRERSEMSKVVEGKKERKGRPSPSYVRIRTLEERKRNHKSASHSASNYPTVAVPIPASGPAPLRRSPRLNPIPDADESDEGGTDNSDDEVHHDKPVSGTGSMTDAQMVRYLEQVYKSDGFDVDPMPDVRGFGLIQPVDLSNKYEYSSCEKISQRAIDEYNRRKQRRGSLKVGVLFFSFFSLFFIEFFLKKIICCCFFFCDSNYLFMLTFVCSLKLLN
jgi:hypothetical protein